MKKSFLFYGNWAAMIAKLPDEVAGQLVKVICNYAISGEVVEAEPTVSAIFESIRPIIDRDHEKYIKKVERINELNAKRSQNEIKTKSERYRDEVVTISKRSRDDIVGVNVNDNVNVNVNVLSKDNIKNNVGKPDHESDIRTIVDYLNQKTQANFKPKTDQTRKAIIARLKEGYTVEDFKRVIDEKVKDWADNDEMRKFLRPQTLFRPANFESYLNESNRPKVNKHGFSQNEYDFDELERKLMQN